MRSTLSCLLTLFVIFNLIGCQSKTVVKKLANLSDAKSDRKRKTSTLDGVSYRLPRTVVQTTIPIKKQSKDPGQFVDFAPCFFSSSELNDITLNKETKFSLDTPTIGSRGEPDPNETYVVKTKGGYFEAKTLLMEYSPSGTLSKGQAATTNTTIDFTIQAVSTIVGIGASVAKIASGGGFALREEVTFGNRSYSFPLLSQCASSSFSKHVKRIESQIDKLLEKASYPENLTAGQAKACLNKKFAGTFETVETCPVNILNSHLQEHEGYLGEFVELQSQKEELQARVEDIAGGEVDRDKKRQGEIDKSQKKIDALTELMQEPNTSGNAENVANKEQLQKEKDKKASAEIALADSEVSEVARELESDYQRAIAAYIQLNALREKRDDLTSTGNNMPADTFKAMLTETDNQVAAYKALFLGTTETKTWSAIIEYIPTMSATSSTDILFNYSKSNGVCVGDGSLLAIQNVVPGSGFQNDDAKSCDKHLAINAYPDTSDEQYVANMDAAVDRENTSGWYYRVPAAGKIDVGTTDLTVDPKTSVHKLAKVLVAVKLPVAQYGTIASIPAKGSGKTTSSNITLDEATGALRNFQMSSSATVDQTNLKDAANAAQLIIEASDPLTRKKRELDLLTTQNSINDARKKLQGSPSPTP